jgi:hypothetical protein
MLENGMMPTVIVTADRMPNDEESKNRLQDYLTRLLSGRRNAGELKVVNKGLEFNTIQGATPKDSDMVNTVDMLANQVCVALQTPKQLLDGQTSNRATMELLQLEFAQSVIQPEHKAIAHGYNILLEGLDITIEGVYSEMPEMRVAHTMTIERFVALAGSGVALDAAAALSGLEVPEDVSLTGVVAEEEPEPEPEPVNMRAWFKEATQLKKWVSSRKIRGERLFGFKAKHLSKGDIIELMRDVVTPAEMAELVEDAKRNDAPFRLG